MRHSMALFHSSHTLIYDVNKTFLLPKIKRLNRIVFLTRPTDTSQHVMVIISHISLLTF